MFTTFAKSALVPTFLRLALAAVFIFHGLQLTKAENNWGSTWMNAHAPEGSEPPPAAVQLAVAWGELIGGIVLVLGLLTRVAALGLIVIMAGAIALVHGKNGFDLRDGGFEFNFVLIVMSLCLVIGGPGPFAVDHFFSVRAPRD